ncbi:MAG: maltokinase [Mycobacterium sp.]|nr:maltokinase [Mycobacterium sp.]
MKLPFDRWLPEQRWYSGRGREIAEARPAVVVALKSDLDLVLLQVSYTDGSVETYQVVVRWTADAVGDGENRALIGAEGDRYAFDALFDPAAAGALLALIDTSARIGEHLVFRREPEADLGPGTPVRVMGAEQSNTSVVFGDQAILKVFRRVTPGVNPDIELTRALSGNPHITALLGSYEIDWDGEQYVLGMVSTFAKNAAEGWRLATESEAGGDFAGESFRLGEAVASVHHALAEALGTDVKAFPVQTMIDRLQAVGSSVPQLRERIPAIEKFYRAIGDEPAIEHRIHGDLHLGQVLRTAQDWLLIDFEGEPGQPLNERRRPDSPLRDVAGMLRSYDYAAHQRDSATAREWAERNCAAFCDGYASVDGTDPRKSAGILRAYELDKAVYEAGYEARYRPTWLPIPLGAIDRLLV